MKIKSVHIKRFKGISDIIIENFSDINAFLGKNNSGKSTILHAIDIACLSISVGNWSQFQMKLDVKDLITDAGEFEIKITYDNETSTTVKSNPTFHPIVTNKQEDSPKSILIIPDVGLGMLRREHKTPHTIIRQLEEKNFQNINALEILYAIKFYAYRNERGLTPASYENLITEISNYFPDVTNLSSDRTENDIATLTYEEYGKKLDILYSGTGLKHFLDILIKVTLSGAKIVLLDEPELGLHPDLQRRFIQYLHELAVKKDIQIFIATHSQVILNYADTIKFYRIINNKGIRKIIPVTKDAIHTVLSDLGIRPSDIFNQDVCLLVEGASDIIFFEHVIRVLYKAEFEKIAIGIIQYGGGAAEGIISNSIDISNIVPTQKYLYWLRDRDESPGNGPAHQATLFKNAIEADGYECHITLKREIEYYYPEVIHVAAQQGDTDKETATRAILQGDQSVKYRTAAEQAEICVPQGKYLRRLLQTHLTDKTQLDQEIRDLIENKLLPWKQEILGENQ